MELPGTSIGYYFYMLEINYVPKKNKKLDLISYIIVDSCNTTRFIPTHDDFAVDVCVIVRCPEAPAAC